MTSQSEKEQNNDDKDGTFSEKGEVLIHEKRYEEAINISDRILKTDQYHAEALYLRAIARYLEFISDPKSKEYLKDKKFLAIAPDDLAGKDLSEAMTLSRDIYLKAQKNSGIRLLFLSVFQNNPLKKRLGGKSEAKTKMEKWHKLLRDKHYHQEEALNILDDVLNSDSYNCNALFYKGEIHYQLANYDIAIAYFRRALLTEDYRDSQIKIRVYIARSQMKLGKINSAYQTLQRIEEIDPSQVIPGSYFLTRAALRSLDGDFINARKDWKRAVNFRSDADSMEELLPLKRYELLNVLNKLAAKKSIVKDGGGI